MPSTRPDHQFVDGVCPACINSQNKPSIDWDKRKEDLIQLLDRFDGECIVPSSGGKDSFYQAIMLKNMGAHVTAVTARTCHLTAIGRKNIDALSRHVKTIEYVPNMTVRAKLNRLGLELVGDISHPEHMAIFTTPFKASIDLKIPLVFYGENPQQEYGGPVGSENAREMTARWRSEFGGFLGLRPQDFVGKEGITERDMDDYTLPSAMDILKNNTQAHFFGQYLPWDSHENARVAKESGMIQQLPCSANWWDFENQDNLDTYWHDLMMFHKYGYGRFATQISVDIRNGLISRESALEKLVCRDGQEQSRYMGHLVSEAASRIGLTEKEMYSIVDEYTNWDLFEIYIGTKEKGSYCLRDGKLIPKDLFADLNNIVDWDWDERK